MPKLIGKLISQMDASTKAAYLSVLAHAVFVLIGSAFLLLAVPTYEALLRQWEVSFSGVTVWLLKGARIIWAHPFAYVGTAVLMLALDAGIHYLCFRVKSIRALRTWGWAVAIVLVVIMGTAFVAIHADLSQIVVEM